MNYEREDDILSSGEVEELVCQGLYPAEPCESSPICVESPTEYPEIELNEEDLARIDMAGNSDTSTPALAPSSPEPIIGPMTYANTLRDAAKKATGFYPRLWQIAVAWAVYYGTRDALVVAGTGYGKTLPFVLNLFLNSAIIVWIVSPLNYIEMDQLYDNAPGVNEGNRGRGISGHNILDRVNDGVEQAASNTWFAWAETGFRPLYATVGNLRRLLPLGTSALAATATANKEVRASIQKVLAFRPNPYVANLGNFRSNLIHIVHHLKGAAGAVKEILHYFPSTTDLPMSLIFVNYRDVEQLVLRTLWDYVDPSMRGRIHFYHAFRSNFGKKVLAEGFRHKVFRILICTESLTMGADFIITKLFDVAMRRL
ncbi:hypothetical protein RSOL_006310, partial [Rhizoctonia solani AG-3 Rhs1AP]